MFKNRILKTLCLMLTCIVIAAGIAAFSGCKNETPDTFTVTFVTNGGSEITAESVLDNLTANKPADPVKEGYIFIGWYTDENCTDGNEYDFSAVVSGNLTLYAKWQKDGVTPVTYTVTYVTNGGSEITAANVEENKTATKPENPVKDGYTFINWYTDENCTDGNEYDFTAPVTANVTLYAKWQKNEVTPASEYTVTFVSNGGSTVKTQLVAAGAVAADPETPTKSGYVFGGWYTDEACSDGNEYDFSTAVNENKTLYAKWTVAQVLTHIITFESNGGSEVTSIEVDTGKTTIAPPAPTKTYYDFEGWYTDSQLSQKFDFGTAITADITLYANWTKSADAPTTEKKTYTYNYSALSGTEDKQKLTQADFTGANSFITVADDVVTWRNKAKDSAGKAPDCIEVKGDIKVTFEGTGTLTVSFCSTGSSNVSGLYLMDAEGNKIEATTKTAVSEISSDQTVGEYVNEAGTYTVTGTEKAAGTLTFEITEAGTYTIHCKYAYNDSTKGPQERGSRLLSLIMVDNVPLEDE